MYREGFDDKFAHPINALGIEEDSVREVVLEAFLKYCNVTEYPSIQHTIL